MGIRHVGLRAVIGASLLSLGAGAGIASAQILPGGAAALTFVVTPPTSIVFGGTATYTIAITNPTPNPINDDVIVCTSPRRASRDARGRFFCAASRMGVISRATLPRSRP